MSLGFYRVFAEYTVPGSDRCDICSGSFEEPPSFGVEHWGAFAGDTKKRLETCFNCLSEAEHRGARVDWDYDDEDVADDGVVISEEDFYTN